MPHFRPQRVNLASNGAAKVLGDAEADMLELLWKKPNLSVGEVRLRMSANGHAMSFNATMTILNRLVEKGVLKKKKQRGVSSKLLFVYVPVADRNAFMHWISKEIFQKFFRDPELFSAAGFVDAVETLPPQERARIKRYLRTP